LEKFPTRATIQPHLDPNGVSRRPLLTNTSTEPSRQEAAITNQHTPLARWRPLAIVASSALLTWLLADATLSALVPPPHPIMEVEDGLHALAQQPADLLVLGSSHTRSFAPIQQQLAPQRHIALVPVEWGLFSSYRWVFDHRLSPILDLPSQRASLREVILVTTFYDACDVEVGNINLPSRAWTLGDFTRDLQTNGLTRFNRNYLQRHWKSTLSWSSMAQARGTDRLLDGLRDRLAPIPPDRQRALFEEKIALLSDLLEHQHQTCWHPPELDALERLLDALQDRGLAVTLVLFPLHPRLLTPTARDTTLARYAAHARALALRRGLRLVDMTQGSPLTPDDFQADFDHLNAQGNRRFADWALAGPLAWMRPEPRP
jgi:hypothetical protein